MKQQKRKGFTLVELLVVIAILAVLATVSIVGYTSFIKKANISNDTALVTQINTVLMADEVLDGQSATMYDALATIEENGFLIEKLTPTTDNHYIVWNSETNRFLLLDEQYEVVAPQNEQYTANKTFAIVHNQEEFEDWSSKNYSIYLADGYSGSKTLEVSAGIDVGNNTDITSITYTGTESVVIRTCSESATVTVANESAEAYWYGTSGKISVVKAALSSVHIYGTVIGNVEVEYGHVVLEKTANVSAVVAMSNDATITVESGATYGAIAVAEGVEATIDGDGVKQDEITTNFDTSSLSKFAGGIGTEKSPYLIATDLQLISAGTLYEEAYFKLISDISVNHYVTLSNGQKTLVFKLTNVVIDGNGHTLDANNQHYYMFYHLDNATIKDLVVTNIVQAINYQSLNNTTFDNVDVYGDIDLKTYYNNGAYTIYAWDDTNLTFVDCDATVSMNGAGASTNYNAVFVGATAGENKAGTEATLKFENCSFTGSIVCGEAAVFLANGYGVEKINIIVNNFKNYGKVQSTYVGDDYKMNYYICRSIEKVNLTLNNVSYQGSAVVSADVTATGGSIVNGPSDATLAITLNEDGTFTIIPSQNQSVVKYVVSIGIYTTYKQGGTAMYYVSEELSALENITTTLKLLQFVDKEWATSNSNAVSGELAGNKIYTLNDISYYLVDKDDWWTEGKVKGYNNVSVSAYDADGNLVASAALAK